MEETTPFEESLLIDHLGLSSEEVLQIVKEWYLNNMTEIFMNEDLEELDEYIDSILFAD